MVVLWVVIPAIPAVPPIPVYLSSYTSLHSGVDKWIYPRIAYTSYRDSSFTDLCESGVRSSAVRCGLFTM